MPVKCIETDNTILKCCCDGVEHTMGSLFAAIFLDVTLLQIHHNVIAVVGCVCAYVHVCVRTCVRVIRERRRFLRGC